MATYGLNDVRNGQEDHHRRRSLDHRRCGFRQARQGPGVHPHPDPQPQERPRHREDAQVQRSVEGADVVDTDMQYLYNDGEFWHFMQLDTFEQHTADKTRWATPRSG